MSDVCANIHYKTQGVEYVPILIALGLLFTNRSRTTNRLFYGVGLVHYINQGVKYLLNIDYLSFSVRKTG